MAPQDPPSGYDMPDLPDKSQAAGQTATKPASKQQPAPEQAPGRFAMQPLGEHYQDGEKNNAAQTVQMGGQDIEVHEKDWLREMTNESRAAKGQAPVTDEMWKAHVATTQYMNDQQREDHQLHFRPGQDATGAENMRVSGASVGKGGEHIFVMDGEGQIFAKEGQAALNQEDDTGRGVHVHHSSFLAGEDIAGAGEMKIDQQGFIKEVTDRSGHYKPGEAQTTQTLNELETKGVNLDNVKFTMDRGPEKTTGMAKEYQQGGEQTFKARHTLADQIKENGQNVREALNNDADRRATRVRKAGEHIAGGMDATTVGQAALEHAAKDAAALKGVVQGELGEQLTEQKQASKASVRELLGKNLSQKPAAPSNSKSLGV